ncbi:MAG: ArsA family ATPase [Lachnospiraceae bacterium]|nr:ArsA family ATPase [Lachnospiraceae bacterium]
MRVIIYTGKGGVGKTSMAAATACRIAKSGKKVLIVSTDQAHSLGDCFDRKIGKEPVRISRDLFAMEIDTIEEGEKAWGNLKEYFKQLLTLKGGSGIETEELLVFPGLEELFALCRIQELYESGEYDTIIVDCAPTGETLSLLKYPERFTAMIMKILPIKKAGVRAVGPAVEKMMKVPMPQEGVFDDIESLMQRLERLQKLLLDRSIVSLRVVTTPEKIVITEAKRNFTCLYLYGYNVDAVIVNHIYPKEAMEGYFSKWMKMQEEGLSEIEESFSEVPRFYVELLPKELRTLEILEQVGDALFGQADPDAVLFDREIYRVDVQQQMLTVYLPFAGKEELVLNEGKGELLLGIRNELRKFPIPRAFSGMQVKGAKFEDGYLTIRFEEN